MRSKSNDKVDNDKVDNDKVDNDKVDNDKVDYGIDPESSWIDPCRDWSNFYQINKKVNINNIEFVSLSRDIQSEIFHCDNFDSCIDPL